MATQPLVNPPRGGEGLSDADRALLNGALAYAGIVFTKATSLLRVTSIGGESKDLAIGIEAFAREDDNTLVPSTKVGPMGTYATLGNYQVAVEKLLAEFNPLIQRRTFANSIRVDVALGNAQYQVTGSTNPTVRRQHGVLTLLVDGTAYTFTCLLYTSPSPRD